MKDLLSKLNFKDGLIPAVIMDEDTRTVLTLCYMNEAALQKSIEKKTVHLFRRSKGKLMEKGETSGHFQQIREIRIDCAGNSLLFIVRQNVAACHEGYFSCYYRAYDCNNDRLEVKDNKIFDPRDAY